MARNVLCVLSRDPYREDGGRQYMLRQWIDILKEKSNVTILYLDGDSSSGVGRLRASGVDAVPLGGPSLFRFLKSLFCVRSWAEKWCFQERFFWVAPCSKSRRLMNEADVIYVDMIRSFPTVPPSFYHKVVLDYDDMLSERYRRFNSFGSGVLGTYSSHFPWLSSFVSSYSSAILHWEAMLIEGREMAIPKRVKKVGFVSHLEAGLFKAKSGFEGVTVFPPSVSSGFIGSRAGCEDRCRRLKLGFIGNNYSEHNRASLIYIFKEVVPKLLDSGVVFDFYVAGDTPPEVIDEYSSDTISFLGRVSSVEGFFEKVDALVCPMPFGTGIKIKILEALAKGVPVVTNSVGVEGIHEDVVSHVIRCDHSSDIFGSSSVLEEAISNFDSARVMSKVEENYGREIVKRRFCKDLGI